MARTALRRRLSWQPARLLETRQETATARTLVLDVPEWDGHLAGQHLDVRLTAEDGYSAQRSYSIAAPVDGARIELTVQAVDDGEVSPFLLETFMVGDQIEVRGPIGRWFVWRTSDLEPVLLVAGGSGIVPLMAMIRARRAARSRVPFRLIYSVRSPAEVYYARELLNPSGLDAGLDVTVIHTREAPEHSARVPGRLTLAEAAAHGWPPDFRPRNYVCGPTAFVEAVADMLVALGHEPEQVRTERFGPTG